MDKTIRILLIVFALAGAGLLGYYWINQWHGRVLQEALETERAECLQRIAELEDEVAQLTAQVDLPPAATDMDDVFGTEQPLAAIQSEAVDCRRVAVQVAAFFDYLDSQGYLARTEVQGSAETLFQESFAHLAANPPANVGEMNNLYGLMRNVTHFYRVLGKDRLSLIKQIIDGEGAVIEPAMAVLYTWLTMCDENQVLGELPPKLDALYQYAAYFLNTLGGRSYLLRRDSKLRMLINYYALLTVDMANDAKRNAFGIDIRPHLDYLFYDINNQKGLMYRERYLTRLAALRNKYL